VVPVIANAPFVGRAEELALLARLAEQAAAESFAAAALVEGEAGIGKTRLVREFSGRLDPGTLPLWGSCTPAAGRNIPFGPWTQILGSLVRELDPGRVDDALGPLAAALSLLVPELPHPADSDGASRGQLYEAATRLVLRTAAATPLLLVIEDLHWADESSQDLLDYVLRTARDEHLLVVVTVRSDDPAYEWVRAYVAQIAALPHLARIRLGPLTGPEVAQQVAGLTGTEATPQQLTELVAGSDGVPFLVEQLVAARREGSSAPGEVAGQVIGHRIRALTTSARTVVDLAALEEDPVDLAVLADVTGLDDDEFDAAFEEARGAGILVGAEGGCSFRHALLREATAAMMSPRLRRRRHATWAEALTDESSGLGTAGRLALHWDAAGIPDKALVAAVQASREARRLSATLELLRLTDQVARLWPQVPAAESLTATDLASVLTEAAIIAVEMGELDRGAGLVQDALSALGEPPDHARAAWLGVIDLYRRTQGGEAVPLNEQRSILTAVPADPPGPERATACELLASALFNHGEVDEAASYCEEGLAVVTQVPDLLSESYLRSTYAELAAYRGHGEQEITDLRELQTRADHNGDLLIRQQVASSLAFQMWVLGRDEAHIEELERTIALLGGERPGPFPAHWADTVLDLVESLIDIGRWGDAARWIDRVDVLPTLPGRYRSKQRRISDLLEVWRGRIEPRDVEWLAHPLNLDMRYDELLAATCLGAECWYVGPEPSATRRWLQPVLGLRYVDAAAPYAWPVLLVAARNEADAAQQPMPAGAVDPTIIRRVSEVSEGLLANNPVILAQAASVRADLLVASDAGHVDVRVDACREAVDRWRVVGRPHHLALALRRLGEVAAAGGDPDVATSAFAEALGILDDLGAAPLQRLVEASAKRAGIAHIGRARSKDAALTPRELEVLCLLAEGATNQDLADRLFISPKTASVHLTHIMAKLGAKNRGQAVAFAHRDGLLSDTDLRDPT
jgi:DNA-binding CsgD family transcriptional regulator